MGAFFGPSYCLDMTQGCIAGHLRRMQGKPFGTVPGAMEELCSVIIQIYCVTYEKNLRSGIVYRRKNVNAGPAVSQI